MNAETKIAIAVIAALFFGVVLIAVGLGWTTKIAATVCGIAVTFSATSILAALFSRR